MIPSRPLGPVTFSEQMERLLKVISKEKIFATYRFDDGRGREGFVHDIEKGRFRLYFNLGCEWFNIEDIDNIII